MASPFIKLVRDASLTVTKALPAAASGTINTDAIAIGNNGEAVEVVVDIPALTTVMLPDTRTMTTTVEVSTVANFATFSTISTTVQTGAGAVGASAVSVRASVPPVFSFVRAKVVSGVSTTDSSTRSVVLAILA